MSRGVGSPALKCSSVINLSWLSVQNGSERINSIPGGERSELHAPSL